MDFVAQRIQFRDIEILHVEEPPQLLPHFPGQVFFVQRGAERAADFVQYVKLFAPPRRLLNQIAVLYGHADLVPQREEQPQLRRCKAPAVRCSEKQHPEGLLFGLQADGHHAAQPLRESQLAESPDGLFFFERREGVIAQVTKAKQASEARHQTDEIIVQAFVLSGAAKFVTQAHGNDRRGAQRITVVQKERPGGQPHNTQHAVQRLRQHALNLAAHKAGGRQIEIRKRQHVALDAPLFFFVKRHDHEHGHERAGSRRNHAHACALEFRSGIEEVQSDPQNAPGSEGNSQQPVGKSFLPPAFLPEHHRDRDVDKRTGNECGDRKGVGGIGRCPKSEEHPNGEPGNLPGLPLGVKLCPQKKEHPGNREKPMIQRALQRAFRCPRSKCQPHVMKSEDGPRGGPQQQISLALDAVDIREKARHQSSGDQQGQ